MLRRWKNKKTMVVPLTDVILRRWRAGRAIKYYW
jgi:hypothetical protein